MKSSTPLVYFKFGQNFHVLQRAAANQKLATIKSAATDVKEFLVNEKLKVASRVFDKTVQNVIKELEEKKVQTLDIPNANEITQATKILFHTVGAETLDRQIYIPIEKRYESKKLLNEVGSLFAKDVFDDLPEIAKFDFKEACNCILFERSTAAAFHLLRGTEDTVKHLYLRLAAITTLPQNISTWGDFEVGLNALPNKPSPELMEQLRHIRKNFRNPTQHPDKRYDIDEVQDLLNLCIDVVNRISKV